MRSISKSSSRIEETGYSSYQKYIDESNILLDSLNIKTAQDSSDQSSISSKIETTGFEIQSESQPSDSELSSYFEEEEEEEDVYNEDEEKYDTAISTHKGNRDSVSSEVKIDISSKKAQKNKKISVGLQTLGQKINSKSIISQQSISNSQQLQQSDLLTMKKESASKQSKENKTSNKQVSKENNNFSSKSLGNSEHESTESNLSSTSIKSKHSRKSVFNSSSYISKESKTSHSSKISQRSCATSASESLTKSSNALSKIDRDFFEKKREVIINKWMMEDQAKEDLKRVQEDDEFFAPPKTKYKIKGIKRARVLQEPKKEEEDTYEKPPVVMPDDLSEKAKDYLAIPVENRLLLRRKKPKKQYSKNPISKDKWDNFYGRMCDFEQAKRLQGHIPTPQKTKATKRTIDRLYQESLADQYPNDFVDNSCGNDAVWTNNPRILSFKKPETPIPVDKPPKLISANSLLMTNGYSSFYERTAVDISSVIENYRKERDGKNAEIQYKERMNMF